MKTQLNYDDFEISEEYLFEIDTEINRKSADYARWIQSSLNRLYNAGLAVDGDIGPRTRAAIRAFQVATGGLTVDGIVGPQTEAALLRAGATPPPGSSGSAPHNPAPTPVTNPASQSFNEALFRRNMKNIALGELQKWNSLGVSESHPSVKNILLDYWSTVPKSANFTSTPGWYHKKAWSAAFISWVVKKSGAGSFFRYSAQHTVYMDAAKKNIGTGNPFKLYRANHRPVQIGDILIRSYQQVGNYDTFAIGTSGAHGDIVVEINNNIAVVVGGNVSDKVAARRDIKLDSNGVIISSHIWAMLTVDVGHSISNPIQPTTSSRNSQVNLQNSSGVQRPNNPSSSIRKVRNGYAAYGGGRVDQVLPQLVAQGILQLSPDNIDMMQRIANVESSGLVNAVNSYDSAYMSFGFMQLTLKYDKLATLINRIPQKFKRYGIEISVQPYASPFEKIKRINGTNNPNDLRERKWAERFFNAGFDSEIIAEQAKYCIEIVNDVLRKLNGILGSNAAYFNRFYQQSARLRALLQETHNNRPAYLKTALKNAVNQGLANNITALSDFTTLLEHHIRERYRLNAGGKEGTEAEMIKKANRIISKTASP